MRWKLSLLLLNSLRLFDNLEYFCYILFLPCWCWQKASVSKVHVAHHKHTVLMNGFWVAAATEIASQTSEDFDILIVVSKAKYEKKLNGQTRFCQDGPNFV